MRYIFKFSQSITACFCVSMLLITLILSINPLSADATDNATLSTLFEKYEVTMDQYIKDITSGEWNRAYANANSLINQSKTLHDLAIADQNEIFEYYASNLYHHCLELRNVSMNKNAVEAIYLINILLGHIEQIQAANPFWLKEHVRNQILILEKAISVHDKNAVRDSAEIIHTSAIKITLSALNPNVYMHTRWLSNVVGINRIGDEIIGDVNNDNWDNIKDKFIHIKHIFNRWYSSFK
ncbi:MAG: hypothetical protein ISR96_00380 [Nitrospira sp.]|nr:hypothetical protein [Nitrospira sp.]